MKNLIIIFCCILISTGISGQQHIESDMLEIPTKTIQYKINKSEINVRVSDFYINRFPESMKQYKLYLKEHDSLNILDKSEHFPKEINLQIIGLDKDEIDFIRNEYFIMKEYNDYPIIGLDHSQIKLYLEWKTENIREQVLNKLNIHNPKSLTYLELLKENGHKGNIPLQTDFGIPHEVQIISAFKEMKKPDQKNELSNKREAKLVHKKHKILKRLKIKNIYEYDLSKLKLYKKLDELILDSKVKDKKGIQEMELKSICSKSKNKYTSSTNPNQIIKPWRVLNIKI